MGFLIRDFLNGVVPATMSNVESQLPTLSPVHVTSGNLVYASTNENAGSYNHAHLLLEDLPLDGSFDFNYDFYFRSVPNTADIYVYSGLSFLPTGNVSGGWLHVSYAGISSEPSQEWVLWKFPSSGSPFKVSGLVVHNNFPLSLDVKYNFRFTRNAEGVVQGFANDTLVFTLTNVTETAGQVCLHASKTEIEIEQINFTSIPKQEETIDITDSPDPFGDGSLVAKYQLNGDAQDTTGNYHGVASNVTYETGKFGQCAVAHGNSHISLKGHPTFTTKSPFSVSMFVSSPTPEVEQRFWAFNVYTDSYVLLRIINSKLEAHVCGSKITSTSQVIANVLHHVVLSFDGSSANLYVDTLLVGDVSGSHNNVPSDKNFYALASRTPDTFLTGKLEQLEMYNRALTHSEITALYNQYIVPEITQLIYAILNPFKLVWANHETYEQANPQPVNMFSALIEPVNNETVVKNNPFYADPLLDQNGNQRKVGYIASTTKINDIPVGNKRVVIVENNTLQIIDETVSDDFGNYRFDSLPMNRKYMITAQYGNADEFTPPEYSAVSADWQTPKEY